FHIGLRAIEAACKASDFRGPATALEASVLAHFGLPEMRTITRVVYKAGFAREEISLLTPGVVAAAEGGDAEAIRILEESAGELASTASGVIRQLHKPGEHAAVYLTGGVFEAGALITGPFTEALRSLWVEAEPLLPRFPPV